jgi:hypothetical protein
MNGDLHSDMADMMGITFTLEKSINERYSDVDVLSFIKYDDLLGRDRLQIVMGVTTNKPNWEELVFSEVVNEI